MSLSNSIDIAKDDQISLNQAALIAGLGLLIMALTVPFAEFNILPQLISNQPAETAENIINNRLLFTTSIFLHFTTLICDIIVAWALYLFFKPVWKSVSLLAAWFRLIYTAMYLIALANLTKVLTVIDASKEMDKAVLGERIHFYLDAYQTEWALGLVIFGFGLLLLGFLAFRAAYVPKIFGMLLCVAGVGYLTFTLGSFFSPYTNLDFLFLTFFGESIFMIWLLVKGRKVVKIKE
jgi:hypothetical protein